MILGSFSAGYKATFETIGNDVTVTFELLDTAGRNEFPSGTPQVSGNALNRNLIFNNLYIMHNDKKLIQAKELELGFSLKPHYKPVVH